jgi:hypothetical protein
MTRDEIMAMGEHALCDWLYQKEVLYRVGADEQEMLKFRGKWNLPACAFAAKDYMVNGNAEDGFVQALRGMYLRVYIDWMLFSPLDWLRAAAIVITEQGAGK